MFQLPALVMISIGATRMYRSLTDFVTVVEFTDLYDDPPLLSLRALTVVDLQLSRTEVAVRMSYAQYPSSPTSDHSSYVGIEIQGNHKPREVSDDDLERGVES
jgi:hypothetical protein